MCTGAARRTDLGTLTPDVGGLPDDASIEGFQAASTHVVRYLHAQLADAGIATTVGAALRRPDTGLAGAWQQADHAMYERKRRRR